MRAAAVTSALVLAITLGGCSGDVVPSQEATPSPSEEPAPSDEPTPSVEPSAAPVAPVAAPIVTTIAPEVMLPGEAFGAAAADPVEITEGVEMWMLPEGCPAGAPTAAVSSRMVSVGDGMYEARVGVQQLAVFADAEAATVEAQRLHDAAAACAGTAGQSQVYVVEDVAVGAQGTGVAYDYYGTSATGTLDEAQGYYVVATRRANAVTIVGYYGGEDTIGSSRENAVATSQAAWELLCSYDSAGC